MQISLELVEVGLPIAHQILLHSKSDPTFSQRWSQCDVRSKRPPKRRFPEVGEHPESEFKEISFV
jgi:hypothetical protein